MGKKQNSLLSIKFLWRAVMFPCLIHIICCCHATRPKNTICFLFGEPCACMYNWKAMGHWFAVFVWSEIISETRLKCLCGQRFRFFFKTLSPKIPVYVWTRPSILLKQDFWWSATSLKGFFKLLIQRTLRLEGKYKGLTHFTACFCIYYITIS